MVAVPKSETGSSNKAASDRAASSAASQPQVRPARPWRAPLSVGLVVVIVAFQTFMGVAIYTHAGPIAKLPVATLVVAVGVGLLVAIDHWIRPRRKEDGMLRLRGLMPVWALLPFVIGLVTSAWLQHRSWQSGLSDVRELAAEMDTDPDLRASGAITSGGVERAVHNAIIHHFPGRGAFASKAPPDKAAPDKAESPAVARQSDSADGDDRADEERRFIELARVVGHDLLRATARCKPAPCAGDQLVDAVARGAHKDTRSYVVMAFAMQALFVLWIPFLLVVSIARAASRLDGVKPARGLDRAQRARRCVLDDARDVRILAEDHAFFAPRLCFAALLLLGTTYVFAPFGLKTSYTMSLVEAHALPGHTSFMLWCNHFAAAPVITVGFVGFLIYALITATQRFAQDDFDDVAMFSLLIRGLTVILLSLALSSAETSLGEAPPRLVVFLAGVFPVRALAALAKRANMSIDPEFETDDARSFACIPSLDPSKVFALRAAGIQSTYDLASVPIVDIIGRVRIDPRLLGRAVDRAILIDAVGDELAGKLAPFAITCASELVAAWRAGLPAAMDAPLASAATRAAERLDGDRRLSELLACMTPLGEAS
ncbi:MAG TPA: hypothetical protein VHW23_47560 [Kofleriaceae bacterium]|jgi:hypothetical protein|nr:hypothetical protein [Kofleriaceae bacterium]